MVVGSRAYGPLRRTLLGSVSHGLLPDSLCPVLVIPRGGAPCDSSLLRLSSCSWRSSFADGLQHGASPHRGSAFRALPHQLNVFVRWSCRDTRITLGAWIYPRPPMPRSKPDAGRGGAPERRDPRGEPHPSGWRVRPGPDGRGAPPPPRPRLFGPGLLIFFLLLLLFNIVLTSTLQTQPARVRIPYSPTFLNQVNAGNVSSISSKGTTVQGSFRSRGALSGEQHGDPGQAVRHRVTGVREQQRVAGAVAVQGRCGQRDLAVDRDVGVRDVLLSFGPAL